MDHSRPSRVGREAWDLPSTQYDSFKAQLSPSLSIINDSSCQWSHWSDPEIIYDPRCPARGPAGPARLRPGPRVRDFAGTLSDSRPECHSESGMRVHVPLK